MPKALVNSGSHATSLPQSTRGETLNQPLISVVIETYNADSDSEISLELVLEKLRAQTYPQESIEVVVVVDEENTELTQLLKERFPWVQITLTDNPSYYGMKIRGIEAAAGDIIALTDADC